MPFKDMFIVEGLGKPAARIYYHTSGRRVFGVNQGQQVKEAMDYIRTVYQQAGEPREYFYKDWELMIGALWGSKEQRIMDVFGATEKEIESGNPEIEGWVVREGVARRERGISCLETLKVVTAEFNQRVEADSLLKYLRTPMVRLPFVSGEVHGMRL